MKFYTINFSIEVIEQITIPLHFVYNIKIQPKEKYIKNIFQPSKIMCNGGINLLRLSKNNICGINLFEKDFEFKCINDSLTCYIAFQRNNFSTNQPCLILDGTMIKLKNIKCRSYLDAFRFNNNK